MNSTLEDFRQEIDAIDDQIVELLGRRFTIISEVKRVKQQMGATTYQPDREKKILERVVAKGRELGLNPLLLQALFIQIFSVSKKEQV